MFEKLILEQPEVTSKIISVEGDISLPNLGLSATDLQMLLDKVSLIFNMAATIRFNEKLRTAVQLNVKGPQQLLRICHQMKHLDVRTTPFYSLVDINRTMKKVLIKICVI